MKVFGQVQLVVAFLVTSAVFIDCYATLEEKAEQKQQKEQHQLEVNGKQNSSRSQVRFGMKTGAKTKLTDEQLSNHNNESSRKSFSTTLEKAARPARNGSPKNKRVELHSAGSSQSALLSSTTSKPNANDKLVAVRHDSHRRHPPSAQRVVAQHKIPIVHKTQAVYPTTSSSTDSVVSSHKRGQLKSRQSFRQPTDPTVDRASRVTQRQSQRSRSSNFNVKDVNVSSNALSSTAQVDIATSGLNGRSTRGRPSISTPTLTTSTSRPFFPSSFQIINPFDFIPRIFGNLSRALSPSDSSRKPPKKYKSSTTTTPTPVTLTRFEEKQSYPKSHLETKHLKATIPPIDVHKHQSSDGPFRIALPTVNFLNPHTNSEINSDFGNEKDKRATVQTLRERYNCPRESEVRFQLFPKICKIDKDCSIWNRDELCCEIFGASSCVSGIPKPLEETSHMPILGVIPRKCPTRPLAELWWEVQECETDNDCWPRVCCPDGRRRYCRTSQPELETVPVPVKRSFNYLTEYLECTAPPPPIFDLHPKGCTSTFDCFPNVCCQEAGLRHCRPPKKSVLTLMANFLNVDFVKRLTQNIVIK